MLNRFEVAGFRVDCVARSSIRLPEYAGSTLRGAFGRAFRGVACVTRSRTCEECLLRTTCVYAYVFETPPTAEDGMLSKGVAAPHPFVIEPPAQGGSVEPGTAFSFGFTLIGRGVDFLPYLVYTFQKMGERGLGRGRGQFEVQRVVDRLHEHAPIIYSGADGVLHNDFHRAGFDQFAEAARLRASERRVTLHLRTPLRLRFERRLVDRLEFHVLMRNVLRRISLLSQFHCGENLNVDYQGFIQQAQEVEVVEDGTQWWDWERYSARQGGKMKLGGLVGHITFEGDLEPFWPFLLMGEVIHVGKGTSFGLGKYIITEKGGGG